MKKLGLVGVLTVKWRDSSQYCMRQTDSQTGTAVVAILRSIHSYTVLLRVKTLSTAVGCEGERLNRSATCTSQRRIVACLRENKDYCNDAA